MVRLEEVSKIYHQNGQQVTALKNISLSITRGEFTAVMGPSGSGKSTLLNLIGGLDQPSSGSVTVDGRRISDLSDREMTQLRRKTIGVIFQSFNLLAHLSVWENVALPLLLNGGSSGHTREQAARYLEAVGLARRLHHRPHELSGGEQQRVAIARALIIEPKILLADEPTGNLDSGVGKEILDLIKTLSDQKAITVIVATHSQQAASYAGRLLHLKDGEVSELSS